MFNMTKHMTKRSPEALGLLHERSRDQRQGAKVDAPIKYHVDPLVCDGRIDDGAFSSLLDLDGHCAALILVCDQGSDVGLDATSTKANDDDSCDVSSEGMASGDRRGKGGRPQNQKTNPVDSGEDQDGVVFAKILISDDGS